MSKEKYTYPCELRPLTAHDIRHLNHLNKRTFNQEGADFEVNVYPFMMEAITELLVEGTELFCISNTPDSDPVLFIERESNINGATLNYEEFTKNMHHNTQVKIIDSFHDSTGGLSVTIEC